MFEQQYILNKIEQWADWLPYQSLKIEVELSNQTLTLEKTKQRPIGFQAPPPQKETGCCCFVAAKGFAAAASLPILPYPTRGERHTLDGRVEQCINIISPFVP